MGDSSSDDDVPLATRKPQAAAPAAVEPEQAEPAPEEKPEQAAAAQEGASDGDGDGDSSDDDQPLAARKPAVKQGAPPAGCVQRSH